MNHRMRRLTRLCCPLCCAGLLLAGPGGTQTFFEDVTEEITDTELFYSRSIAWGDYDNDGWPDLFLVENANHRRFKLWHNEGSNWLGDRTSAIRTGDLPPPNETGDFDVVNLVVHGGGALFGDCDNDGDLDLFVPLKGRNRLLRNDRGTFIEVPWEDPKLYLSWIAATASGASTPR